MACPVMNRERFSNMDMDTKEIEVNHKGPITIISINRHHVRNAINKSTAQALKDAWLAFEADENAVFGCFERRFGVPLVDGGTQRLPRIIGFGRALEMILTGKSVSAREALASGLVNEVVAPGHSLNRAVELAQILAKFPQVCMRNDRQAVYAGLGKELPEGLRI